MKKCDIKRILVIVAAFLTFGCASVNSIWTDLTRRSGSDAYRDEQVASREEAARKYGRRLTRDRFEIESSIVTPGRVRPESKVESSFQYTILLTDPSRKVEVIETRFIDTGKEKIKLAERSVTRSQGTHYSQMSITIPKDIPAGSYAIISIVKYDSKQRSTKKTLLIDR